MEENILNSIVETLDVLSKNKETKSSYFKGEMLCETGNVHLLARGKSFFEMMVEDQFDNFKVSFDFDQKLAGNCSCKSKEWCPHRIASIMEIQENLLLSSETHPEEGKAYSREGMMNRVLKERSLKAKKADYTIHFSNNLYGEHILVNEKSQKYKITFRDFKNHIGYCSCKDYQTNKLGTCKHLIYAFEQFDNSHLKNEI